jgi:DNA-3-methyladenine glycosylase I
VTSVVNDVPPPVRCGWASGELSIRYHDEEWGVPVHDDRTLFEFLILEGAQAGLSWNTILNKRDAYRKAFGGFDPARVARYDRRKIERLLRDPGIVRNKLKVASAVGNARAFLQVQKELGSFDRYIWQFVGGKPRVNAPKSLKHVPASTPESDAMSKDLKKRGFNFVGSTICYAFMQAVGMVNDHVVECFRYQALSGGRAALQRPVKKHDQYGL